MIELNQDDYQPLDSFPLKWRWTDEQWTLLPPDVLAKIRPLTRARARELYETIYVYKGVKKGPFEIIDTIEVENKNDQEVRDWLMSNLSKIEELVVASWSPDQALVTTAGIFCDHWDDFCYPSSDDLSLLPITQDWILFYSHEEVFFFGQKPLRTR